jgi:hypothetical protein
MEILITLTEKEILETPNNEMLGEKIRNKYWEVKRNSEQPQYDKCVICGKDTPYLISTHIDFREGYLEGAGQGCYQKHICENK